MKTCIVCQQSKALSLDNFYASRYTADGYADVCRSCEIERTKTEEHIAKKKRSWYEVVDPTTHDVNKAKKRTAAQERKKSILQALKQGHKDCTHCGQTKRLFDFHVNKKTMTGYDSWCKDCKREAVKSQGCVV